MTAIPPGSVVVGVDGSDSALDAVRWAAIRACSAQRPLHLVHVTVWPLVTRRVPPGVPAQYREVMVDAARGWLHAAREVAARVSPAVPTSDHLITGDVAPVLIELSRQAHEIVVGSRGLGGFTGMLVGSIAMVLAQHAHCPVVIVRQPGSPSGPVVVGVDGSAANEKAVEYAFDAAGRAGAPLIALHTWSDVAVGLLWGSPFTGLGWEAVERDEQRLLAERLAGWQQKFPDVPLRPVLAQDRPARRLREMARDARLLVVGSRGRGGFSGLLLGSTSRALVHHAPCPLAVIPVDRAAPMG